MNLFSEWCVTELVQSAAERRGGTGHGGNTSKATSSYDGRASGKIRSMQRASTIEEDGRGGSIWYGLQEVHSFIDLYHD